MSLRLDCKSYHHICDHAGLVCDTADIARRSMVIRNQDGGSVSMAAILNFGSRPTSDNVDRVISEWPGLVENMPVEVGIAAPSRTVEKCISTSGLVAAILNSSNQ
jgi:hypothetical protein